MVFEGLEHDEVRVRAFVSDGEAVFEVREGGEDDGRARGRWRTAQPGKCTR
ncbi:MAG: hypothetical protein ABIJ48_06400 [Actinomycetota bacterium]